MATTEQPSEPLTEVLIPSFPNDVALNILARVPRHYHPVLSAVSKSIRSTVSSPHFFAVRSLLNCSESITYLNVGSRGHSHVHRFAVHRNPNPTNDSLLQYAPVPPIPVETPLVGSASAAMGPKIYVLGGYTYSNCDGDYVPSSDVWILDCRSHTWERGPSMRYPRDHAEAIAVDGKVYVVGGFPETLSLEVLDPAVGRWEAIPIPIPIPSPDDTEAFLYDLKLVDGKISFRLLGDEEFRLDRTTKTWEVLQNGEDYNGGSCVVDGVSYHLFPGLKVKRFDNKVGEWKELKHVEGGKPNYVWDLKLLNLKGRLVMVFGEMTNDSEMEKKIGIWCAEIDVMKNADGDWCGQTHWSEKAQTLPRLRFHTWERGPSIRAPRYSTKAAVVEGKVFVVGGDKEKLWVEMLDLEVGEWETIRSPFDGVADCRFDLKLVDDKISIVLVQKEFRYDPSTKTWEVLPKEQIHPWNYCDVDGVSYSRGVEILGFDERTGVWIKLKGVMEWKPEFFYMLKLLSLKGRLVIAFAEAAYGNPTELNGGKVGIWCAEVDVMKVGDGEWREQAHWLEKVRLLPDRSWRYCGPVALSYDFNCLSVSL